MQRYLDGEFSNVQVNVRFVRRYGFYLLTLYVPTILLMVIAYATFFFNIDDFNSRIVVALTALLVLSSLFTQVAALPCNEPYEFTFCIYNLSSNLCINHFFLIFLFLVMFLPSLCALLSILAADLQLTPQDFILQAG